MAIFSTNPEADGQHFFRANLDVEFTAAPDSASLELQDAAGLTLAGATSWNDAGTKLTLDPVADLEPTSDYAVTITWAPTDYPPFEYSFRTDQYGLPIADPEALVDVVYNLDLPGATFVEPAGLGGVLINLMQDLGVLLTVTADSDLEAAAQPALHMLGALGNLDGADISQDLCTETLSWTAGPDELVGTGDDTPATFDDPFLRFGPASLDLSIGGSSARMSDASLVGVWHPDGRDLRGGEFEALIDTRGLDALFDKNAEEGAICELASDTLGVNCEECGEPIPGVFCLYARAIDVVALRLDGMALEQITCPDILANFDLGLCTIKELASLDPDGDGVPTCP